MPFLKCFTILTYNFPAQALSTVSFLCEGGHLLPSQLPGEHTGHTRLPLGMVNLLGMHIIPPLTINAGTHFTYPQRDRGLSQPTARLSWEQVLNLGPVTWWSAILPTELSQPDKPCKWCSDWLIRNQTVLN